MHSKSKRRAARITTAVLAIALLIGGTLAWNDFSQHASNPFGGGRGNYSVTLNDVFNPVQNWQVGEKSNKKVSVTNLGESEDEVFVRLSLKEFMQTREQSAKFITDADGNEILFATFAQGPRIGEYLTLDDANNLFPEGDGGHHYEWHDVKTGEDQDGNAIYTRYATTNETENRNGIYGKPMLIPGEIKTMWGTALSGDVAHKIQSNAECDYEPYFWDEIGALGDDEDETGIRDYIDFTGADTVKLADWAEDLDPETGEPKWGQFWIVDPHDGWAYWGEPLEPGTTTGDFINGVKLNNSPLGDMEGSFDYFMHIDMQAIGGAEAEFEREIEAFNDESLPNRDEKQDLLDKMLGFVRDRAKGDPIGPIDEIFKDENAQQIVATIGLPQANGDTSYVIHQQDIDNTKDEMWKDTFADQGITDITGIEYFVNLTHLDLSRNQLSSLPDDIGNLTKLTHLQLWQNPLESLPRSIGKLNQLIDLQSFDTALKELPDTIVNLESLKYLWVQRNQLEDLPENFQKLTTLEVLALHENQFKSLPDDIGLLANLTDLRVNENHLSSLPENIQNLSELKTFQAQDQSVTLEGQESIGTMLTLENPISVFGNPVAPKADSIKPDGVYQEDSNQLAWNNLTLDIEEVSFGFSTSVTIHSASDTFSGRVTAEVEVTLGKISEVFQDPIAADIVATNGLPHANRNTDYVITKQDVDDVKGDVWETIFVRASNTPNDQKIKDITGIEHFVNLTALNLHNNALTALPENIGKLTNLTALRVWQNQLTSLPEGVWDLTNLTVLNFSNNALETLPKEIGNLKNLNILYGNSNQLKSLPKEIGELSKLSTLQMDKNQLETLPDEIGDLESLELLHMYNNHLKSLPDSIGNMTSLRSLHLSQNDLQTLPDEIWDLRQLESLLLTENRLETLPDSIGQLTNLETLYLGENKLSSLPEIIQNLENLKTLVVEKQSVTVKAEISDGTLTMANPIFIGTDPVPPTDGTISDHGIYDEGSNEIRWNDLPSDTEKVEFEFDTPLDVGSLVIGSVTTPFSGTVTVSFNENEVTEIGKIGDVFQDENAAQIVADEIGGGNLDYVITQTDIDNTKDDMWQDIFAGSETTPENEKIASIKGIEYFVNLTALDLSNNALTSEGIESVFSLTKLETLQASSNQLSALPQSIDNLTSLTTLDFENQEVRGGDVIWETGWNGYVTTNRVLLRGGGITPSYFSHDGVHYANLIYLWPNLTADITEVYVEFDVNVTIGSATGQFSGKMTFAVLRTEAVLRSRMAQIESYENEPNVTAESWNQLQAALTEAQSISQQEQATEEQLVRTIEQLEKAVHDFWAVQP